MLANLVLVLLCALGIQCAPSVIVSASCEENACNATCRHQFQGSFGVKTVGKCENNECQCYRSAMCDPKACQRLCQERYGNGTDVRSECLSDVCNCAWKGTCVLSECKRQCADRFPGNPNPIHKRRKVQNRLTSTSGRTRMRTGYEWRRRFQQGNNYAL
ncbi:hypothetical protein MTO96_049447 [Rhipicephalus appendiculatus]